jgi:hypothetical protein
MIIRSKFSLLVAASVMLLAGALAAPAGATEIDKSQFKKGCESGGGSYVENNDGSFQCNAKSGSVVKCADTKSQCTASNAKAPGSGPHRPPIRTTALAKSPSNPKHVVSRAAHHPVRVAKH